MLILGLGLCISGATNAQNNSQSINCGADYIVKRGDYLSTIANQVYGNSRAFTLLFDSNAAVIGSDPNTITPGLVLNIPCFDESEVQQAVASTSAAASAAVAAAADADNSAYRFVFYDQWAPFLDDKSDSGGMLTEIVRRALEESDEKPEHKIHFVGDFSFILDPLLIDHAYDMSVGFTKPKCEAFDALGEESQLRCTVLDWSQPLYEEVIAYHSLIETPSLNRHSQLAGKRICRPEGYTTADMDTAGVKEPAVTMVRPDTAEDCMNALLAGDADFAALATDVAEGLANNIGAESQIKVHEPLSHVSTVHVVIAKSHPQAQGMIQVVDNGLSRLKESGEWFNIVRSHMTEHRKQSQ